MLLLRRILLAWGNYVGKSSVAVPGMAVAGEELGSEVAPLRIRGMMPSHGEPEAWPLRAAPQGAAPRAPAGQGAAAAAPPTRARPKPRPPQTAVRQEPARELAAVPPKAAGSTLGFVLFLLVNAVLFIRPAEVFPSLQALPIYEVLILGALVTSLPVVIRQMMPANLLA